VSQLGIVFALVFLAFSLGIPAIYRLVFEALHTNKAVSRRLQFRSDRAGSIAVADALREVPGLADFKNPLLRRLNDRWAQTGLRLARTRLLLILVVLTAVCLFALGLLFGFGLLPFLAAIPSALLIMLLYLEAVRRKRIARFAELLPDCIDVIVRGIRVGYPLPVALDLVARELPDPIASEFGLTADEISFGQDVRAALANLYRRVGHEDLLFLIVAINVQTQTGGNLAEILSRLSRLIRNRVKLHLKVRALSAEGRVSAVVLSLMPFILVGGISLISPAYFGEIRHEPLVFPVLVYGALSLIIGNLVMYRMVNFKF
jgi:tight adherence protein B